MWWAGEVINDESETMSVFLRCGFSAEELEDYGYEVPEELRIKYEF